MKVRKIPLKDDKISRRDMELLRRKKIAQKEYKKSSFINCICSLEKYKSSIIITIDKSMKDIELSEEYINEIEKSKNNIRNQINKLEDLLRKNIKEDNNGIN